MIKFVCRCGNKMQAADDEAGLVRQCPRCGLLVDIPTSNEQGSLETDGTYRLDNPVVGKRDENLDQLTLMYYPGRALPDGTEIDLRGPVEGRAESEERRAENGHTTAGQGEGETSGQGEEGRGDTGTRGRGEERKAESGERSGRPKYDPTTGELVTEIQLEEDGRTRAAPGGKAEGARNRAADLPEAKRVIDYNVSPNAMTGSPHGMGIFAALFQPMNVIVMTIIFVAHVFFLMTLIVGVSFPVFIVAPFVMMIFLAGHYGALVEEMGPAEKDELPRPLRDVHPWDDFFVPFMKVMGALILCYWPIPVVLIANAVAAVDENAELPFRAAGLWLMGSWAVGSVLFPAVLLTVCTSGTISNLRPDRLARLMWQGSWQYVLFVALWLVTWLVYVAGVLGTFAHVMVMFTPGMEMPIYLRPFVTYPLLLAGIYLGHAFCWALGMYYRQEWRNFPWVAQYHVPKKVVTLSRPKLHPKVEKADGNAAARAARRGVR